jgi:hypothetical protein
VFTLSFHRYLPKLRFHGQLIFSLNRGRTTDLPGCHKHRIWPDLRHPSIDLFTPPQVEFQPFCSQDFATLKAEASDKGRAHHTGMACHEYPLIPEFELNRRIAHLQFPNEDP